MDRRTFLRSTLAGAGAVALGDSLFRPAQATTDSDAEHSSYGSLCAADLNGLQYPAGFTGRVIARSGLPVGRTPHLWPPFPDGAACFAQSDGGWILVVNSENPPALDVDLLPEVQDLLGGASAISFNRHGRIVDAYWVLRGTRTNCAGGATPWGSWLSCEEFDYTTPGRLPGAKPSAAGRVWECFPDDRGGSRAIERPTLGRFKHEAATFDEQGRVYLTEDMPDGCLYRFTPSPVVTGPESLESGEFHALKIASGSEGSVSWVGPIDAGATNESTRVQASGLGATIFDGGEGCFYDKGVVLFTTKGDDRVWALTVGAPESEAPDTIEVLYDGKKPGSVLTGVDNIIVSPHTGNIYVAEDGSNMEVVVIETDDDGNRTVAPLVRATGPQHGYSSPSPVPTASEITGLALSPDGRRLYFSGQRSFGVGITYEVHSPAGRLL